MGRLFIHVSDVYDLSSFLQQVLTGNICIKQIIQNVHCLFKQSSFKFSKEGLHYYTESDTFRMLDVGCHIFRWIWSFRKSKNQTKLGKLPGTKFCFQFLNTFMYFIFTYLLPWEFFCNINLSTFQKIFMPGWLLTKRDIIYLSQWF